jgi:hypothetical protein
VEDDTHARRRSDNKFNLISEIKFGTGEKKTRPSDSFSSLAELLLKGRDGTFYTWGNNQFGALGLGKELFLIDPPSPVPLTIPLNPASDFRDRHPRRPTGHRSLQGRERFRVGI